MKKNHVVKFGGSSVTMSDRSFREWAKENPKEAQMQEAFENRDFATYNRLKTELGR